MTLVSVVQAIVNFDYRASHYIKSQYRESINFRFEVAHCVYRTSEVIGRTTVLVAYVVICRLDSEWASLAILLDYLLGWLALRLVCDSSCACAIAILSFPIFIVDVSRYVDEAGFAASAQKLS